LHLPFGFIQLGLKRSHLGLMRQKRFLEMIKFELTNLLLNQKISLEFLNFLVVFGFGLFGCLFSSLYKLCSQEAWKLLDLVFQSNKLHFSSTQQGFSLFPVLL
jgi:hypothetical protein